MLDKAYKLSIVVVNAIFIGVFLAMLAGHLAFADRFEQAKIIRELSEENRTLRDRVKQMDAVPPLIGPPAVRNDDWRRNGVIDDPRKRTGKSEK